MTPKALPVDELLSYAVRTDAGIRVQLRLPKGDLEPGSTTVRLRAGRRTLDAPADINRDDNGIVITFVATGVPGRRAWQLILRPPDAARPLPLAARLLAAPGQPVALLPGPTPATQMAPPQPRHSVSAARRLARRLPEPVKRPIRRGRTMFTSRTRS